MSVQEVTLTKEFKTQTTKAITAIAIFLLAYTLLFVLAVGLTALCVYGGYLIIMANPRFFTIALGIGLASLGFIVLFFLLNFIFKTKRADSSHLYEIKEADEPELFRLIGEIVDEVGTDFPKKVYLSHEVNAAVFYDSSFWSMFLPVRKNLLIGLGLVNTVTKEELKAVLAHEFGHFSQRTMKVGSYVYNVNHVIFNTLYENESYEKLVESWANISGYISIFAVIAVKLVAGIQWILRQLYALVNKSYLALSREMEFHADEIAASVTGFEPLKTALLRINLADHSYNRVLSFYDGKIADNLRSANIYSEQAYILNFLAEDSKIRIKNNFPDVSLSHLNKFNKSRLVVSDQWASHPGTAERIEKLEKTGFRSKTTDFSPANEIFKDIDRTQRELTNKIFLGVKYEHEARLNSMEQFQLDFHEELTKNSFSKIYNSYYDNKNLTKVDLSAHWENLKSLQLQDLYSDEKVDLVYTAVALGNDIDSLEQIADGTVSVKTFDYDGKKYNRADSRSLVLNLKKELEKINEEILKNDQLIFNYFNALDLAQNEDQRLKSLYQEFFDYEDQFEDRMYIPNMISERLQFLHETTPFDEIRSKFQSIASLEARLKENIRTIADDPFFEPELTREIRDNFETYLARDWQYFRQQSYLDENLAVLFSALHNYTYLLARGFFVHKREILKYQENLLQ